MSVDQTSAAASTLRTLESLNRTTGNSNLSQQDFLKILVAQMANQNPLEPAGHGEFLAQMAQFSLLEGFQTLSQSFATSQAYGMIGKYVYIEDSIGLIFGKVDGVVNENGVNYVLVGGETYNTVKVAGVMDPSSIENNLDTRILQGANLIGKTVSAAITAEDGTVTTITGQVEQLVIKDGDIFAVVGGQNIPVTSITQIA
ncbi:MAG: flagellar hook capping FlgD N-terminal domain-containing protein [Christensenellales bacterium]